MLLTKPALDMFVEDIKEPLWAVCSLKILETFFNLALSYNLSLDSIRALKSFLLFFKDIYEFIDDFLEGL